MKKNNINYCENCNGGLRCWNPNSPCYLGYCGEYPNTGSSTNETNKKGKKRK